MTDKAKELIDKYLRTYPIYDNPTVVISYTYNEAKQCALIAVDEVIKALQEHQWQNRHVIDEYEQLKKELDERI